MKDRTGNTRNIRDEKERNARKPRPASRAWVISFEEGCRQLLLSSSFSPPPSPPSPLRLLHDISIFVNANGLRNFAVHPGGHHVCVFVFFFLPPLLFLPPFSLLYFFVAASFCFAKLIQPDSPAAFNQRDDLRFSFFFRRARVSVNFIPPRASVFVLSRPIVLCKWGGGTG